MPSHHQPPAKRPPLPKLRLSVQFADPTARAGLPRHVLLRWIRAALRVGPAAPLAAGADDTAQITVRIVDAEEGRALNHAYRGKDYATNVLTFDYVPWPPQADIVLCAPVVAAEAAAQHKPLQDHYAHLVVHGVLHASGWDHQTDAQAQAMEHAEVETLARLGLPDPYRDHPLMPGD